MDGGPPPALALCCHRPSRPTASGPSARSSQELAPSDAGWAVSRGVVSEPGRRCWRCGAAGSARAAAAPRVPCPREKRLRERRCSFCRRVGRDHCEPSCLVVPTPRTLSRPFEAGPRVPAPREARDPALAAARGAGDLRGLPCSNPALFGCGSAPRPVPVMHGWTLPAQTHLPVRAPRSQTIERYINLRAGPFCVKAVLQMCRFPPNKIPRHIRDILTQSPPSESRVDSDAGSRVDIH
jgi:hypothetical protein